MQNQENAVWNYNNVRLSSEQANNADNCLKAPYVEQGTTLCGDYGLIGCASAYLEFVTNKHTSGQHLFLGLKPQGCHDRSRQVGKHHIVVGEIERLIVAT